MDERGIRLEISLCGCVDIPLVISECIHNSLQVRCYLWQNGIAIIVRLHFEFTFKQYYLGII